MWSYIFNSQFGRRKMNERWRNSEFENIWIMVQMEFITLANSPEGLNKEENYKRKM
jgi:hypothetical protein